MEAIQAEVAGQVAGSAGAREAVETEAAVREAVEREAVVREAVGTEAVGTKAVGEGAAKERLGGDVPQQQARRGRGRVEAHAPPRGAHLRQRRREARAGALRVGRCHGRRTDALRTDTPAERLPRE